MKVAIVILNWNGRNFLEKFLPNVILNSPSAEVIVADNHSSDDSVSFLQKNFPDIRLIINEENGGFAKGYNDALKHVEADIYVLLNSDVEVSENWLSPIIKVMQEDEHIAACQPKLLAHHDHSSFEYAGAAGGYIDKYGFPFCRGRIFDNIEKDNNQYNSISNIFWATGACMFVRSDVYWQAGGLDEDFFAHMEEIDLCWRMKNLGYTIKSVPESVVYHVGGGTLPKSSSWKTHLNFRNNLAMLYKNTPRKRFLQTMLIKLLFDGVAAAKFLISGEAKSMMAVFKAHLYFYTHLGALQKKRRKLKHVIDLKEQYSRSIVLDYYLRGKKKFDDLQF